MNETEYLELLRRARAGLAIAEAKGRFEIPRAAVQTIGRQTFIRNIHEIARALRREPAHIAKFLFKELAVPGSLSPTELILQGKVSADLTNARIETYVKEFVLCDECKKPDTVLLRKDRLWFLRCEACGASRPVRAV